MADLYVESFPSPATKKVIIKPVQNKDSKI